MNPKAASNPTLLFANSNQFQTLLLQAQLTYEKTLHADLVIFLFRFL